jgi:hypothetical protein
MLTCVVVVAGWLLVGWLPGMLIAVSFRPNAGWLRNSALAPVLALAVNMICAQALQALGVQLNYKTVLPSSLALCLAAWAVMKLRRRPGSARPAPGLRMVRGSLDASLLTSAVVLGATIWFFAIPSLQSVLPNDDGTHHGLFAWRILRLGTLDPHQVLAGDLATHSPALGYYPLALHLSAALVAGLTGASVSAVLTIAYVLASSVVLPVGIFVLSRRLFPAMPHAAGVAAIILAGMPLYPHGIMVWGGITTIVGMSLLLPVVDLAWRSSVEPRSVLAGLILGLACYGLFTTHNSELVSAGLFALLLVAGCWSQLTREDRRDQLITWFVSIAVFAGLVLPQAGALVTGSGERSVILAHAPHIDSAAVLILVILNGLVLMFALPGAVMAIRHGWARGWLGSLAAVAALCVVAQTRVPVLINLTVPWYASATRVAYLWAYFGATYAAIGVVLCSRALGSLLSRRYAVGRRLAFSAGPAIAAVACLAAMIVPAEQVAGQAYEQNSLIGADQRAAFVWLSQNAASGDRVLNQFFDGSAWMGPLSGVTPVFQTALSETAGSSEVWGDRWYLLTHAADLSNDTRARAAAREWQVRYVYVNDQQFYAKASGALNTSRLAASAAYERVWSRGRVTIFQIVGQ